MASEKFFDFLSDAFSNMEKVMADDASIYVFHADTEGLNFRKAFDSAGFYLSGCCIWKKQSLVLGRFPYQCQHEPCLYGWKKKGKHRWYTGRKYSAHPLYSPFELSFVFSFCAFMDGNSFHGFVTSYKARYLPLDQSLRLGWRL